MDDDQAEIAKRLCPTCKQDIPSANYDMHAIHCKRFLTTCPQCGESVNKNSLQEHIDENHVEVKCDVCGERLEKMDLESHKTSTCPKRSVNCKYCEIAMLACEMGEHEEACGSRTDECENCKRRILLKDLEDHIASGCETPHKENDKSTQDPGGIGKPERLIGGGNERWSATGGYGFPFHPQFQPNFYTNEETTKTSDLLNNGPSRFTRPVPTAMPRRLPPTERQFPTPQDLNSRQIPFNRKSRGPVYAKAKVSNEMDTSEEERTEVFKRSSRGTYNSSSDSDEIGATFDDDEMKDTSAPKPSPDLTDETFLPCEFCSEMLPADSLNFHQANCDQVPPTPRSPSSPKFQRLSLGRPFPSRASSFEPYLGEASSISKGYPFRRNIPDIGAGSGPCEFCLKSYPFVDLALHQVQCPLNPNLQIVEKPTISPPPERKRQDPDVLPSPDLPKPYLSPLKQTNSSAVSKAAIRPSPNIEARSKRTLAPTFLGNAASTHSLVAKKTIPPDQQPTLNDPGNPCVTPERKPRQNRRKSKPISKKTPATTNFREVNVLGGEAQGRGRPIGSLPPNRETFNGSIRGPLLNSSPFSGPGINDEHAADMKYLSHSDNPRTTQTAGVNQGGKNRNPRGYDPKRGQNSKRGQSSTRGQNFSRGHTPKGGYNRTRGRPYGSNTITIPARQTRSNNSRQVSGISTEDEPADLAVQGRPSSIERQRGSGQRLGSGDSRQGIGRSRLCPPKDNNWK
ncbi:TRAF-type zinc finger domain-containing protein 1-like [Dendronephthya gigantea]|uniref:TRAF-type zinc finger domain-containing protein 1-like n=1 Tax=Dendronephthya gigantea TaxID=151771 RepID=UPI00106A4BCE|nr:TRAF-type zinc finger domain-containing protein 1-like [Dendronephthya gigantea]